MTVSKKYRTPGIGASLLVSALRVPVLAQLMPNVAELRYQGRRSGRRIALPVACARIGDTVVVRVARAESKTWWRNFARPHPASIRRDGRWVNGMAHVAYPGTLEHEELTAYYQQILTHCEVPVADPLVVIELPPPTDNTSRLRHQSPRDGLWRRWTMTVTAGEAVGFAAPALAGVLVRDAVPATAAAALLAAGLWEGTVLGAAQARVLIPVLPGLRGRSWITATVLGSVVAWSIALVAMAVGDSVARWPAAVSVPLTVLGALSLLLSIGTAQWIVLRPLVTRAYRWIAATAAGWLGGLAAFFALTSPLWQPGQPFGLVVLIGIAGGLVMATVMAAVTGWFLVAILAVTSAAPAAPKNTQ